MSSRPEPLSATTNYASVRCLDRGLLFSAGITIYVFLVIFFDVDSEFGFNVFFFFFLGICIADTGTSGITVFVACWHPVMGRLEYLT
jgi:hypothetical protein